MNEELTLHFVSDKHSVRDEETVTMSKGGEVVYWDAFVELVNQFAENVYGQRLTPKKKEDDE